ncbi:hypothetical protein E2C01_021037 [Portunus trituberculatus]|uniref:Uncharacterized protein n=1 Tax=Portunus trituberculatus TaxID=210409 RepID=A0A5B7E1N7_PORTR|nr:hypothetical protein [Portunus trituberculatus]
MAYIRLSVFPIDVFTQDKELSSQTTSAAVNVLPSIMPSVNMPIATKVSPALQYSVSHLVLHPVWNNLQPQLR